MPTVITVIAANALPMIIVNSIMPTPNTMMIRIASSLRANSMITMTIPSNTR